jgi:16S rRNA G966 N2-methylase RsmD
VDSGAESARLVMENARALGLEGSIELLRMPVARALPRLSADGRCFSLVFADPPYAVEAVADVVRGVGDGGLLAEGGTVVVEHGRREMGPELLAGLKRVEARRFGDTVVSLYRAATVP